MNSFLAFLGLQSRPSKQPVMHFVNDRNKRGKISKRLDAAGQENVFVSSVTLYELNTKLIRSKVSPANVKAL